MDLHVFPVAPVTHKDIKQAWLEAQSELIKTASYLVAESYEMTEAEVVASGCGRFVTRLWGDWRELLNSLNALGPLKVQIRNGQILHEVVMDFANPLPVLGKRLLFRDEKISLKLEINRLQLAFLIDETFLGSQQLSICFFDLDGSPVMRVVISTESQSLCMSLLKRFFHPNQSPEQPVIHLGKLLPEPSWPSNNIEQLRDDWRSLCTSEGIWLLLDQYGVNYQRLLDMLDAPLVRPIPNGSFWVLLELGMDNLVPFKLTSRSTGAVLEWVGIITQVAPQDNVLCIKGEGSKLSINIEEIDEGRLVELPGAKVPSLVVFFNARGEHLLSITTPQKTKEHTHIDSWRHIVDVLVTLDS